MRPRIASTLAPSSRTWALIVMVAWFAGCTAGSSPEATRDKAAYARADTPAHDVERPAAEATSAVQTGPKVIFLGDSLAAGLHLRGDQAFPALLQRQLQREGLPFRLVNAGISGDTTAGGVRRIAWLLKQTPQIVVVELGANDGMRGVAVSEMERNLRTIVAKIHAAGARPLLLGLRLPPSYGEEYAREFEAVYTRVASELAIPWIPFFMEGVAGVADLNLPDGIHPTAAGHERLAANIAPKLKLLVRELGASRP